LTASSEALSTTANNLANLNTIGYKDQQIQFADLFYQSLGTNGAGDPIQQGAGVTVSSKPSNFTEGNVTPTGVSTDVAVSGNGFFVVKQNGVQSYTRAGNFEVGTDNLLETADGQQVLGYPAVSGVVSTSGGLTTLALGAGTVSPATVTKNVTLTSNLDATASDGSLYTTQANIYDSLGGAHAVTFNYTNEDAPAVQGVNAVTAQKATGTLTTAGGGTGNTIVAGSTISVGGQTYTFYNDLSSTPPYGVLVGATDTATIGNLVDAINKNSLDSNASGGTNYVAAAANTQVIAAQSTNGAFIFTAITAGATPIATATSNGAVLSWNGGAGANGVNAVTAQKATGTLTTAGGGGGNTILDGSSVSVGGVRYTFSSSAVGTTANAVLIGATDAETIGNLVEAIMDDPTADPSGGAASTDFGSTTIANPEVTAAASTNGAFTFTAITAGAITVPTATSNGAVLSWNAGAGTNGVNGVTGQAATGTLATSGGGGGNTIIDGSTMSVGGVTYTFMTGPVGATANAILIGATDAATIGNLVDAINGSTSFDPNATAGGANFGTLTAVNPQVTAARSTNGAFTFTAKTLGAIPVATGTSNAAVLSWNSGAGANGVDAVNAVTAVPAVVNKWGYAVTIPSADLGGAASANPISLATGTLVFNGDGTVKSITPTGGAASLTNPIITIPPASSASSFADGANPLTFTWHVVNADGTGLLTQEAAPNSTASIQQDGGSSGTLKNFNIGSDGTITGSFSNGTTAILGQIALASFADNQGLSRTGNNDFSPTLASGQPTIGAPTSGGLGSISGGALEQSNVDIATEFANLIVAQRSYEANARVVTTFDQVAQATIALKP
jgi:flagellar hook protein FlgE